MSKYSKMKITRLYKKALKKKNNFFGLKKIKRIPRYQKFSTDILSTPVTGVDSASFVFMFREIFIEEVYKFTTTKSSPKIIDCGANIGLSVIYFKKLYPNATIIAFEPDKKIFETLVTNINSFGFENITLHNFGLWNDDTTISFLEENADGGRVNEEQGTCTIDVRKLSPFLQDKVDLLKIDIEGAEYKVLKECEDLLINVENIFVEYHSMIGEKQQLGELIQLLTDSGFRIYINTPGLHSKKPFVSVNTFMGMDMQVNIFGIRGEG